MNFKSFCSKTDKDKLSIGEAIVIEKKERKRVRHIDRREREQKINKMREKRPKEVSLKSFVP